MILDNEQQRDILLEMFGQMQFPGRALDVAYSLMQAIKSATIAPDSETQLKFDAAVDARDMPSGAPAP